MGPGPKWTSSPTHTYGPPPNPLVEGVSGRRQVPTVDYTRLRTVTITTLPVTVLPSVVGDRPHHVSGGPSTTRSRHLFRRPPTSRCREDGTRVVLGIGTGTSDGVSLTSTRSDTSESRIPIHWRGRRPEALQVSSGSRPTRKLSRTHTPSLWFLFDQGGGRVLVWTFPLVDRSAVGRRVLPLRLDAGVPETRHTLPVLVTVSGTTRFSR